MWHSNRAADNARICYLFIELDAASGLGPYTLLTISSLICKLIQYLTNQHAIYPAKGLLSVCDGAS